MTQVDDLINQAKDQADQNNHESAERIYRQVLEADPAHPGALNNLGISLESQGKFQQALNAYDRAASVLPDEPRILYNIAHALHSMDNFVGAEAAWRNLLEVDPSAAEAHFALGNLHADRRRFLEASVSYLAAADLAPDFYQAYSNLGMVLFELGQLTGAESAIKYAVTLNPSGIDYFNLAKTQVLLSKLEEAEKNYRLSLSLSPQSSVAYQGLASLLLGRQSSQIQNVLDDWALHIPDDPALLHLISARSSEPPSRAPNDYITSTFDLFASDFEATLEKLHYQAPQSIAHAVELAVDTDQQINALDLGCGTGLSGLAIKPFVTRLTGVDLSQNMLEKASEKAVYDELHCKEIGDFLNNNEQKFELVIACDTFNYFGNLHATFAAARTSLTDKGLLIFTVEYDPKIEQYKLEEHGRYSHSINYIYEALQDAPFASITHTKEKIRMEAGKPVTALVVQAKC